MNAETELVAMHRAVIRARAFVTLAMQDLDEASVLATDTGSHLHRKRIASMMMLLRSAMNETALMGEGT
jgi:hypothetical protein